MKKIYRIIGNGAGGLNHNFEYGDEVIIIVDDDSFSVEVKRIPDGKIQFVSRIDFCETQEWWDDKCNEKVSCSKPYVRYDKTSIKNIYVNESKKCVAVKFEDEDVRVIHCSENDSFDIYVGVALAIAKKAFGSSEKFHNKVDRILKKGNK